MTEMASKKFSLSLFSNNREVVPGDAGNVPITRDETVCPLQLLVYCSLRMPGSERLSGCYGRRKCDYEWSFGCRWDQLAWSAVQGIGDERDDSMQVYQNRQLLREKIPAIIIPVDHETEAFRAMSSYSGIPYQSYRISRGIKITVHDS